jgi:DNA-binding transcriptional LysR family regulator
LIQDLQAEILDVGLTLGAPDHGDLRAAEIWTDHTCILLPSNHPLAQEASIDIQAVAHERLIVAHQDCSCGARASIDAFIRAANAGAQITNAANLNVLRTLVRAGQGVGLVSSLQAQALHAADVICRPLQNSPALFRTFVMHRCEDESPFALRFFDLARRMR